MPQDAARDAAASGRAKRNKESLEQRPRKPERKPEQAKPEHTGVWCWHNELDAGEKDE
eukprot:CAMPEP_0181242916 /NCGR_PEP_ID=MMETSP1096-20121128/41963_1 /TAXON_ID=156174 ORGANISM="Chrysochromulina ericina, Strain CCMP281" /NCGR_SAMPLE_ID=MMETSP1096 /ASSEMBLY_ACC=CAM_ASM_000453 /LENGTH=57 /DNA_ID=CAMNT_0023339193 /DNA_START=267 /DNA_END=440 /DNA_ORIENTATION=+